MEIKRASTWRVLGQAKVVALRKPGQDWRSTISPAEVRVVNGRLYVVPPCEYNTNFCVRKGIPLQLNVILARLMVIHCPVIKYYLYFQELLT
jgi:hypothetical protein